MRQWIATCATFDDLCAGYCVVPWFLVRIYVAVSPVAYLVGSRRRRPLASAVATATSAPAARAAASGRGSCSLHLPLPTLSSSNGPLSVPFPPTAAAEAVVAGWRPFPCAAPIASCNTAKAPRSCCSSPGFAARRLLLSHHVTAALQAPAASAVSVTHMRQVGKAEPQTSAATCRR